MLSVQERVDAAEQWSRWWRALVDFEVRTTGGYATPRQAAWRADLDLPFEDVGSGPRWEGLLDRPALQKAVLISRNLTAEWLGERQFRESPEDRDDQFELAKSLATAVILEYDVSPDLVRALVIELLAPGEWWSQWSPGVVVASGTVLDDAAAARAILQSAYWSVV